MIKVISVLKRKNGLEIQAFHDYWLNIHGALAAQMPGLRRYVQSHTLLGGYREGEPAADGIAELWFDDTNALRKLKETAQFETTMADHAEFIKDDGHAQIFTDERVIKDGSVPTGGVKNIEFVKRRSDLSVEEFQKYWLEVHGPLGAAIAPMKRYVQSHTRQSAYNDGKLPAFDGMAMTWFEDTGAMRASAASREYVDPGSVEESLRSKH